MQEALSQGSDTVRRSNRRPLNGALAGQVCAFLIAVTGACSAALSRQGVSLPTTQNTISYVLLSAVYCSLLWKSGKRRLTNRWYFYVALAALDVEANFVVVLAFRFTSITSVTLLDCFSIPTAIALSWLLLRTRYKVSHWLGALLCISGLSLLVLTESPDAASSGQKPSLGDALVLLGATMYGTSNVVEEKLLGEAGNIEVLAMGGICGLAVSGVQAAVLEGHQLLAVAWTWQAGMLMVAYGAALAAFSSLVPFVLLWSGAAVLNLSLLTSDLWAGLARILFFGGFQPHQALSFAGAFMLTAIGLAVFAAAGDDHADQHTAAFQPLEELRSGSLPSHTQSGELENLRRESSIEAQSFESKS